MAGEENERFEEGALDPTPQPAAAAVPARPIERFGVHHSYIWLGSLRAVGAVLVAGVIASLGSIGEFVASVASGDAAGFGTLVGLLSVAGAFLLIAIGMVVYQAISYKHIYYELGDEEFTLYSGVLNKKRVHVPYRRVQSVDERASLLQRIFGVCTVSIDTAGGSANKAITVPYVARTQADYLRAELFARKQQAIAGASAPQGFAPGASAFGAPGMRPDGNILDAPADLWNEIPTVFGGAGYADGIVTCEYGLSNKELVLAGVSNSAGFAVAVITIVAGIVQLVSTVVPVIGEQNAAVVGGFVDASVRLLGGSIIAFGVAMFAIAAIAVWGLSVIGTCISYGGFRVRRRSSRIEVERGLLQHRFSGVDVDRVQSVIVKQGVIRRIFGYCELQLGKIDAASGEQSDQQGSVQTGIVVHPFVKKERVPEILAGILPEFSDVPVDVEPLPRVALRRGIIRRAIIYGGGFGFAVVIAIVQIVANLVLGNPGTVASMGIAPADAAGALGIIMGGGFAGYAICAVAFVLEIVGAVLWYRGSGFAYNDRFMTVRNGGLSVESVGFPRRKIQFGNTKTNPFQRRAGTATVCARTAAGVGGTTVKLVDADAAAADAWLAWLEPRPKNAQARSLR